VDRPPSRRQVTKKFGKGPLSGRVHHRPYVLELLLALYYLVGLKTIWEPFETLLDFQCAEGWGLD
jgi:hypothetical protein